MSNEIKPVHANSRDGGEVYRLLNMVHIMAGALANNADKRGRHTLGFKLAYTENRPNGSVVTAWTNGVVNIEARSRNEGDGQYHEYSMTAAVMETIQ